MAGKGAFNKHSGSDVVGGSPSDSIATKHGGSVKKFSHTSHPGGHPRHPHGGHAGKRHGPRGRKM